MMKMKWSRFLVILLFPLFVSGPVQLDAATIVYDASIDGVDTARLENQLIYYSVPGGGPTGANIWGHEIAVDQNGVVVESAANVTVPAGGFALSAHGTKKVALQEAQVGDLVEVDLIDMQATVTRDVVASSYYRSLSNKDMATHAMQVAVANKVPFPQGEVEDLLADITMQFTELEGLYEQSSRTTEDETRMATLAYDIARDAEHVVVKTAPTAPIEIRALWHRPNATSIKEENLPGIERLLDRVAELGFNTLYVETFWNGYVSYRSEMLATHPQVASFTYGEYGDDYIAALIGEATKRNIDVHAWIHTFNAGNQTHLSDDLDRSWLVENYQGDTLHPNAYGGSYYLDPSQPDVIDFVVDYMVEMVEKYDFAGIQLDYIRYYDNNYHSTPIRESGFSDHANQAFLDAYGLEGDVRTLILDESIRSMWFEWRQQNITDAVRTVSDTLRAIDPTIVISADVVGDITSARNTYMQDWLTWVRAGYIDLLAPMIYTASVTHVDALSERIFEQLGSLSYLSAGIAPVYYGHSAMNQHDQMLATQNTGGNAIFASHNVIGDSLVESIIREGLYRTPAVSPLADVALLVDATLSYVTPLLDAHLADGDIKTMFQNQFATLADLPMRDPGDYQEVLEQAEHLASLTAYLQDEALAQRIRTQFDRLAHVIDVRISRDLYALGFYDPLVDDPRPDPTSFEYPDVDPGDEDSPEDPGDANDPDDTQDENEPESDTPWTTLLFSLAGAIVVATGTWIVIRMKKGMTS
jgi:uncharacterized lipoprotein YddW (UPF0748 family)